MRFTLDGKRYFLDLTKAIELERSVYQSLNEDGVIIEGKVYKFDSGIVRTALKMVMTPVVIPLIRKIYMANGIVLDPPVKHTDLIDYAVNALLDLASILEKKVNVDLACEISDDNIAKISSATPIVDEERTLAIESPALTDGGEND